MLTVGSLFSGIGGFDLGLERAGMRVLWHCEQDEFCRRVLAKHWPDVPCYPDVRALTAEAVEPVDVLCGGFPCQDLSLAGKGAGIDGARSGLWSEYARLVGELRPRYVLVENVPALLARGFGRLLGDLAALGYDAEWDCLPASAFGAPHRRDRVWLVAYPERERWAGRPHVIRSGDPDGLTSERGEGAGQPPGRYTQGGARQDEGRPLDDADGRRHRPPQGQVRPGRDRAVDASGWATEPAVGRVADGFSGRVEQLAALGNALVPQIAEWIGRRIIEAEQAMSEEAA